MPPEILSVLDLQATFLLLEGRLQGDRSARRVSLWPIEHRD